MRARVLHERCACGSVWSLGLDALVHARDMEPSYRDWQARHADCAPSIERHLARTRPKQVPPRRVRLPLLRQLIAWLFQPAT